MKFKQHTSCEGCSAYLPNNPDLPCCGLDLPIDIIEPLEKCYKPGSSKMVAIIKTLRRNPYGENR